jgi:hypothetical protein
MKAAVAYILLFTFCLAGAHKHAHASAHYAKAPCSATHNTVHQQQNEVSSFIDAEDENDDKDITRKLTHQAKWSILVTSTRGFEKPVNQSTGYLSPGRPKHVHSDICIEQRVLRI